MWWSGLKARLRYVLVQVQVWWSGLKARLRYVRVQVQVWWSGLKARLRTGAGVVDVSQSNILDASTFNKGSADRDRGGPVPQPSPLHVPFGGKNCKKL